MAKTTNAKNYYKSNSENTHAPLKWYTFWNKQRRIARELNLK